MDLEFDLIEVVLVILGDGFKYVFIFHPKNWGRFSPILTSIFFRWVGEKPPTLQYQSAQENLVQNCMR